MANPHAESVARALEKMLEDDDAGMKDGTVFLAREIHLYMEQDPDIQFAPEPSRIGQLLTMNPTLGPYRITKSTDTPGESTAWKVHTPIDEPAN